MGEKNTAIVEFDNVMKHFDRIMSLLSRKCKGRFSLKRILEEYCAFRLLVLYFEKHFQVRFEDEEGLVKRLEEFTAMFEEVH